MSSSAPARKLQIRTAEVFERLLGPARYKGAYGGRGSGKSHFFAEAVVERCMMRPATSIVCIREVQRVLAQSSKKLIENKIQAFGVSSHFDVLHDRIKTPGDGVILFNGMQDHTAESIKSLEGMDIAYVDEAQALSARSLSLLRPTIRKAGSELWFGWNPRRKSDAVDDFLRNKRPDNAIIVEANWHDNPWFPPELDAERRTDLELYPDRYDHIWNGAYAGAFEGAYFAKQLLQAKMQGRIGRVGADPLLPLKAFFDLGGAGAKSDAMAIWIVQFVGREIRVLDYIEGVGQALAYYVTELRSRGYEKVICHLPHDGANTNAVTGKRYVDHLEDAGFTCEDPVPNQGQGAASLRIEAVRRILPRCWFNEATTEAGRDALGFYHEKKDDTRVIGLGPAHDWSSHCFTGDTKVLTRYGTYPIRNLPETGEVLTWRGWRRYTNPRMTRRNAPLVEVRFTDGLTVRCTPDHLFAVEGGWKSAESLQPGSRIRSGWTLSRLILMVASIVAGQATDTGRAAARSCTAMYGQWLSGQFRRAATFITATAIRTTTCLPIWNACLPASTCPPHGKNLKPAFPLGSISLRMRNRRLPSGIDQRRVAFGIGDMRSGRRAGRSGSASRAIARSAAFNLMRSFARAATPKSIAALLARLLPIANASSKMFGPKTIASVRKLNETADVWCLTVPHGECFALANGAIVHNCADAFGLMAIVYEEPRGPKNDSGRGTKNSYDGATSWSA